MQDIIKMVIVVQNVVQEVILVPEQQVVQTVQQIHIQPVRQAVVQATRQQTAPDVQPPATHVQAVRQVIS